MQIFGAKKIFLKNLSLSCTTSYGFLAPCQNLEKVNDTIQTKRLDRWKIRRTDRPYFIGPFQLLPGVEKGDKKIANYRLTSLLNLDYQIYTTYLKNYMQKTLDPIDVKNNQLLSKKNYITRYFFYHM